MCRPHSVFSVSAQRPALLSVLHPPGARLTPYAHVPFLQQRIERHLILVDVVAYLLGAPRCQRSNLCNGEVLFPPDHRRIGPLFRLGTPYARDPSVVAGERSSLWFHLAHVAAKIRVASIELIPELLGLRGDR